MFAQLNISPIQDNYLFNLMLHNPALAGLEEDQHKLALSSTFYDFKSNQETRYYSLGYETDLPELKSGIGFKFYYDQYEQQAESRKWAISFVHNFKFSIAETADIRIGWAAGMIRQIEDFDQAKYEYNSPTATQTFVPVNNPKIKAIIDLGFGLEWGDFIFGAAFNNTNQPSYKYNNFSNNQQFTVTMHQMLVLNAQYEIGINEHFSILPAVMLRTYNEKQLTLDGDVVFKYLGWAHIGVGYRYNTQQVYFDYLTGRRRKTGDPSRLVILAGVDILNQYALHFGYNIPFGGNNLDQSGFDIHLQYKFKKRQLED